MEVLKRLVQGDTYLYSCRTCWRFDDDGAIVNVHDLTVKALVKERLILLKGAGHGHYAPTDAGRTLIGKPK